jgi:hypothetical protein
MLSFTLLHIPTDKNMKLLRIQKEELSTKYDEINLPFPSTLRCHHLVFYVGPTFHFPTNKT